MSNKPTEAEIEAAIAAMATFINDGEPPSTEDLKDFLKDDNATGLMKAALEAAAEVQRCSCHVADVPCLGEEYHVK